MGMNFPLFDVPAAIYAESELMRQVDLPRTLSLNLLGLLSSPWARTGS